MAHEIRISEIKVLHGETARIAGLDGDPRPKLILEVQAAQNGVDKSVNQFSKRAVLSSIQTAIYLAESPTRPHHFNFENATDTIVRGLRHALMTQSIKKEINNPPGEFEPLPKVDSEKTQTPKFMTLEDIHVASTRELVAAG